MIRLRPGSRKVLARAAAVRDATPRSTDAVMGRHRAPPRLQRDIRTRTGLASEEVGKCGWGWRDCILTLGDLIHRGLPHFVCVQRDRPRLCGRLRCMLVARLLLNSVHLFQSWHVHHLHVGCVFCACTVSEEPVCCWRGRDCRTCASIFAPLERVLVYVCNRLLHGKYRVSAVCCRLHGSVRRFCGIGDCHVFSSTRKSMLPQSVHCFVSNRVHVARSDHIRFYLLRNLDGCDVPVALRAFSDIAAFQSSLRTDYIWIRLDVHK